MSALRAIPVEPVLRNLAITLDAQQMLRIFQERIFKENSKSTEHLQIKDCRIERIKHKPEIYCLICYRLIIKDRNSGHELEQILTGRVYREEKSAYKYLQAQNVNLVDTSLIKPLMYFEDLDMVLWTFPNDRRLPGLPALTRPDFLKRKRLPDLVSTHLGEGWEIRNFSHSIVKYTPEKTCMVRVQMELQHNTTGKNQSWTIYGKTFAEDQGKVTDHIMRQLWKPEIKSNNALNFAKPLGYLPAFKTSWQEGLPGVPLSNREWSDSEFLDLIKKSAKMIAALHQTPVECARKIQRQDIVEKLERLKTRLNNAEPTIRAILEDLVDRLLIQADNLDFTTLATLHGDLHLKNILVERNNLYLIDLDTISLSPPLFDVGNFIAWLLFFGPRVKINSQLQHESIKVFVNEYIKSVPWKISRNDLDWHVSFQLVYEHAERFLKQLKFDDFELMNNLVKIADAVNRGESPWKDVFDEEGKMAGNEKAY